MVTKQGAIKVESPRDLTHDVHARDWQEYADACFCHDIMEPVCNHAYDLAHEVAMTAPTT